MRQEKWKAVCGAAEESRPTSLGCASKRSQVQREEARRQALAAVNKARELNAIVIFTDGSARPNPGPTGAGVYVVRATLSYVLGP